MAEFLSDTGCEVILIDNNSTYPPLLEWYEICPYKVHRLSANYGHMAFWNAGIFSSYTDEHFVVTDCDLDLSGIPLDYIDVLMKELPLHRHVAKSGLSLSIKDLPVNHYTDRVLEFESRYWDNKVGRNGFYDAPIDTTFALYNRNQKGSNFWNAIRSPSPYTAKHLPWYLTKELILNDLEQLHYIKTTTDCSFWSKFIKSDFGI